MRVLVTGADGFIGQNLCVALRERGDEVLAFTRGDSAQDLPRLAAESDAVAHLAGANRPLSAEGFQADNVGLSGMLADALRAPDRRAEALIFASSTQAALDNPYGRSKLEAEQLLEPLASSMSVSIFRLPNVFGKWARPFYNSAVATFCHQAARGETLTLNDPAAPLTLVYVDDVVKALIEALGSRERGVYRPDITPEYRSSVGDVAALIEDMARKRTALGVGETGHGLARALYATYLSHLPPGDFSYRIPSYGDARGSFIEVVKTPSSGQMSVFTQVPGLERGGHYHHSKSEKFLVVQGHARFRFRHLLTGDRIDIEAEASEPRVVDTIPGWTHDVQNLGQETLVVLVWANEIFDRERPDTIIARVEQ
jgi:UDP-2-acetamido-2,6-beta-L-arabino-hexul-4-ose reductase